MEKKKNVQLLPPNATSINAAQYLSLAPGAETTLPHLADLLHLFHHRNKNQHRHSIWYRHFSTFRKQLNHLLSAIDQINANPQTWTGRAQQRNKNKEVAEHHVQRMKFWRDVMVTKWHFAFGQLVADQRFAVLGVFLLAVLAEVCRIVGITAELEELGEVEVQRVLEEFGKEEWREGGVMREGEDLGEVVKRKDHGPVLGLGHKGEDLMGVGPNGEDGLEREKRELARLGKHRKGKRKSSLDMLAKREKKKRKKSGNAIDEIFG